MLDRGRSKPYLINFPRTLLPCCEREYSDLRDKHNHHRLSKQLNLQEIFESITSGAFTNISRVNILWLCLMRRRRRYSCYQELEMPNWLTGTIVERHQWNNRLCSLRILLDLPEYEAGQFINLGLEINGKAVLRPYSLVNPPGNSLQEIFFNRVDDGLLSPRLFQLQPGDKVLSSPKAGGFFVLSQVPAAQQLWLCATGTGLSPFLSMLRTVDPWESYEQIILIHGVRDQSEMAYCKELEEIQRLHSQQFHYFHSVTREPDTPHLSRRIPDLLLNNDIENLLDLTLSANNAQVMLCGNSGMINGCLSVLAERGLKRNQRRDPGQITIEIYQ